MKRRMIFLPVIVLVAFAAYLGLRAGTVPTETEVINRYAATYVATAGDGAALTDCAATSHPDPIVRMVIHCAHQSGLTTTYFVGPRGESIDPSSLQEPSA
ncbi:hypothetical protein [Yoonia sp. SS1-5]|uniref:Uncharacterized protein n=1 Tax=Yoonia rhodophyticola TaxID=3137370 RepID=A0AAN0NJ70_9RHOB